MKTFSLRILFFGMLAPLLFLSCTENEPLFQSTEDKLQGQWRFERVKFQKNFSFSRTDLTSDYEDLLLEFNDDFSVTMTNTTTGQTLQGSWQVDQEWVGYTETTQFMEVLEGALVEPSTGEVQLLDWNNLCVTENKITSFEYKDNGHFSYTLERI
jgi:hypothetical protein